MAIKKAAASAATPSDFVVVASSWRRYQRWCSGGMECEGSVRARAGVRESGWVNGRARPPASARRALTSEEYLCLPSFILFIE